MVNDKDTVAEAVVLFDIGKSYFVSSSSGLKLFFERITRIKIFKEAGLKYGEIEIPYYVDNEGLELVFDIEGTTYNYADDKLNKSVVDKKLIFEEKKTEHWYLKKFALPDVKKGSIIEIKYTLETPYFFNLRDWEFQWRIPVVYSQYEVRMIPFYSYSFILQGAGSFDVQNSYQDIGLKKILAGLEYNDMVHIYGMKNLPAFRDESFITSINDYIIKLDFQLSKVHHTNGVITEIMSTWPKLIDDLIKNQDFGKYSKSAQKEAKKILTTLNIENANQEVKLETIVNYIKSNYNWNGNYDKFAYKTIKDFLKEKTGNSANINLFLYSLLSASGLEVYPVIISTRNHGKIPVERRYFIC